MPEPQLAEPSAHSAETPFRSSAPRLAPPVVGNTRVTCSLEHGKNGDAPGKNRYHRPKRQACAKSKVDLMSGTVARRQQENQEAYSRSSARVELPGASRAWGGAPRAVKIVLRFYKRCFRYYLIGCDYGGAYSSDQNPRQTQKPCISL